MDVYLAGPILHADDSGVGWRERAVEQSSDEINCINPLDMINEADGVPSSDSADIVRADKDAIRNCDCLIVNWETVPTAGTPMEILFAYRNRIPVLTAWDGEDENLSPWVRYHSSDIVESVPKALSILSTIVEDE